MEILLVEDNERLNEINRRTLEEAGYSVRIASSLAEARKKLSSYNPDVILLDVALPDGNGMDLCREIREETDAHILFLTCYVRHADKLRGLKLGGDDYITKPFKLDELLSRIAAIARRRNMDKTPTQTLVKDGLKLDVVALQAFAGGIDLKLQPKEFALLLLLSQNENETLSVEMIYEKAWGQPLVWNPASLASLRKRLSSLRKKLEGSGYTITAKYGKGYTFEKE